MAGIYPDVPSRRHAYDVDGSVFLYLQKTSFSNAAVGTLPPTAYAENQTVLDSLQSEDMADSVNTGYVDSSWFTILFPEKREIDGIWFQHTNKSGGSMWSTYSLNSTNGIGGTWTSLTYVGELGIPGADAYRQDITSKAVSNVKALMVAHYAGAQDSQYCYGLHIYGTITPGETPDRLIFLDTLFGDAVFTKVLDYGDVPRGQTSSRTFKVKNNSSTKQANTVQVTAEDVYLGAGSWYTFSDDDVSYQATFPVGNLGTGATKTLYIKQIVPDAAVPGPFAARIKANQASWT